MTSLSESSACPASARRARPSLAILIALLAPALGLLGSCASGPAPVWATGEYPDATERLLWRYSLPSLEKTGYPLGAGIDPIAMKVRSGWQTHLSPFKDRGSRRRAHMRIVTGEEGQLNVEARVEVQRNAALVRPSDPRYAEWEDEPDDEMAARLLLKHVHAYVGTPLELNQE